MPLQREDLPEGDVGSDDQEVSVGRRQQVSARRETAHAASPDPDLGVRAEAVEEYVVESQGVGEAHCDVEAWGRDLFVYFICYFFVFFIIIIFGEWGYEGRRERSDL